MLSQEYLKNPRMSQSKLKRILDGVEEFKYALDNPPEETDAMKLGTAVHLLLLQPELSWMLLSKPNLGKSNSRLSKIWELIVEGHTQNYFPISTKKTKKQEEGVFYEVSADEYESVLSWKSNFSPYFLFPEKYMLLDSDMYQQAYDMAASVRTNSDAMQILSCCESFEQEHYFDYSDIPFKAQLDGVGSNFVLDLKTTRCENKDHKIQWEVLDNGYDFQAALYLEATGKENYYIIFVRNEAPYSVFPVKLSRETLERGKLRLDDACGIYKNCLKNNPEFKPNNRLRII